MNFTNLGIIAYFTRPLWNHVWNIFTFIMTVIGFEQASVIDTSAVMSIDLIFQQGIFTRRLFGHSRLPVKGFGVVWHGGPVFGVRTEGQSIGSPWVIYAYHSTMRRIACEIEGDPNKLDVVTIINIGFRPDKWRTRIVPPKMPYPESLRIVTKIMQLYDIENRASAIVCGPPGVGKSTLVFHIASALKDKSVFPVVYRGIDLTTKYTWNEIVSIPSQGKPAVVVLDEFDNAVINSGYESDSELEDNDIKKKSQSRRIDCHASNTGSLHTLLDTLAEIPYLIVVATSNRDTEWEGWRVAGRKGRFDMIVSMDN